MSYFSEHKKGFLGTIIVHGIVLLLLLLCGFFTPLPLPGEEGILVNFGTDNFGQGQKEPVPKKVSPPPVKKEERKIEPRTTPPKQTVAEPVKAKQEVLTQDLEKTAAVESAKKKREEEKKRKEELDRQKKIREQKEKERIERERLAEVERKKQEELARIEKEKEEQRLREEAEKKQKEEEQRRINEINARAKNVFGSAGQGNPDSESSSQGVTYSGGNQGSSQGTSNNDNYQKAGGAGNGISYSLGGRSALELPLPYYPGNEEGVVVVQVTVDKYGKVTKAVTGARGSTTLLPELLSAAQKAAMQAKFNTDTNAPAFQQGTITYRFVLD